MLRLLLLAAAALSLTAAGCRTARPDDTSTVPPTAAERPATPPAVPSPAPSPAPSPDGGRVMGPGVGDPLSIPLGETVQHNGHAIRFVEVVEDSRCPTDVTCVWEGRARVAITIDGTPVTLTVPYASQQETEPSMLESGMIAVEVVGLDPYPGGPDAGDPVTLRVVTRHAGM